jgi:hypothetical protein
LVEVEVESRWRVEVATKTMVEVGVVDLEVADAL